MKKLPVISLLLGVLLSGCAAGHTIEQQSQGLLFSLRMPKANKVQLALSTDSYMLHDARLNKNGTWQVTVPEAREMKYFYIVDGIPYRPECRLKETDDFGSENCLYQP